MEAGTQAAGAAPGARALGVRRRRWGEEAIRAALFLAAAISVLTTILIVVALLNESIPFFQEVGHGVLHRRRVVAAVRRPAVRDPAAARRHLPDHRDRDPGRDPDRARLGDLPLRVRDAAGRGRSVKPVLEVLVGVPTIVFGYFALTFVTPTLLQDILGLDVQVFNALAAGLVMGFMIVPTIASISEDSMSAVPQGAARGRLRPRRDEAPGGDQGRLPGRDLRHRRLDRARRSRAASARR